jgi:hypothetical protein
MDGDFSGDWGGMDPSGGYGDGNYGADMGAGLAGLGGDMSAYGGGGSDPGFSLEGMFNPDMMGFDLSGSGLSHGTFDGTNSFGFDSMDFGAEEEGFGSKFSKAINSPLGKFSMALLGMANPAIGMGLGMLGKATTAGQSPGKAGGVFGGTVGSAIGSGFGPVGGLVGGALGSALGSNVMGGMPGYSGSTAATPGDGNLGTLGGVLGSMYQGYQGSKDIGGQIKNLNSLYGQNSPYSQMLRQQLERRDAAGGRRSQYGPREVELQAKLAEMNSRNAPTLAGLYDRKMANRNMMLKGLGYGYDQMGGIQGLRNMFQAPPPFELGGFGDNMGDMGGFSTGGGMSGMSPVELPDWGF